MTSCFIGCRWAYICHFKNVGVFNDDFVLFFFTVTLVGLPAYLTALAWFADSHKISFWYDCSGLPDDREIRQSYQRPMWQFGLASILLHAVLFAKISLHERKAAVADSNNIPMAVIMGAGHNNQAEELATNNVNNITKVWHISCRNLPLH